MPTKTPLVLTILDGWGINPDTEFNAIHHAQTPTLDRLAQEYSSIQVSGSGEAVGLPPGQMGNSEVGHINIGSGRIVYQEFTRINKAITDGEFTQNQTLISALTKTVNSDRAVHIMGLLSPGGVHSHLDHFLAMIRLAAAQGATHLFIHAFLDGRDTPPQSAQPSIEAIEQLCAELGVGQIASLQGRFYAMDRDQRFERVQAAYRLLTEGGSGSDFCFADASSALQAAYDRDEVDEFVQPTWIHSAQPIQAGDSVFFMNFRADRARQITRAFVDADFSGFERPSLLALSDFVMLTEYAADIKASCAFPSTQLNNVLGEWLEKHQKTQLRIAETEKYAHVTFFFNGGREQPFVGEQRALIPSPNVKTYDLQPEMSAIELTQQLVDAVNSQTFDVIICNYANGDMVGHTGNFAAAVKACETVDQCLEKVVSALQQVGGECLITADHGNAEKMRDEITQQPHTAHTNLPVPFIYVGRPATATTSLGKLSDIAPTMLHLLGLSQPPEMTGNILFTVVDS